MLRLASPLLTCENIDLQRDVLEQAEIPLRVAKDLQVMDAALFIDAPMGLRLKAEEARRG